MLLSASKFNASEYKREMIQRAKDVLANNDDPNLRNWHAARESTLLRIFGENERSYDILQDHIHNLSSTSQGQDVTYHLIQDESQSATIGNERQDPGKTLPDYLDC